MVTIEALVDRQIRRGALREEARRQRKNPEATRMRRTVEAITISRQEGTGVEKLAAVVANKLGFELVDRQILDRIVKDTGVRERLIRSLDEQVRSGIDLWVEGVLTGRYIVRSEYTRWLFKTVNALAEHGGTVFLGRGANVILRGRGGLHVRIVAPLDQRIRNVAFELGTPMNEAARMVENADYARRRYFQDHFATDIDNPHDYDLIINIDRLPMATVEEMIVSAWNAVRASTAG